MAVDVLAEDIEVSRVELNQGVAIQLVHNGHWISPLDRKVPVVQGRDTLLRVHWTTAANFEARAILVRLTLDHPDLDEPILVEQTTTINADGFIDLPIMAADMVPGLRFAVTLLEGDPARVEAADATEPLRVETAPVGVQPEPTTLKVVLVPMRFEWPGCSTSVDVTKLARLYEDMAFMKSPIGSIELEVRTEPVVLTTEPVLTIDLLEPVIEFRASEEADPASYYFGVYERCGTQAGSTYYGVAPINIAANPETAWMRVGVGFFGGDPQRAADEFVHQLGHLQGLGHVECPGTDPWEPDFSYPYKNGLIGVWGFGLRDGVVRDPDTAHDFMSYCYEGNWSSDWTWLKTFERSARLTSWGLEARTQTSDSMVSLGQIGADGRQRWLTTPGRVPAELLDADPVHLRAYDRGQELALTGARIHLPDSDDVLIAVEQPATAVLERVEFVHE